MHVNKRREHTDQSLDSVLVPLRHSGLVDVSQLIGVQADELWLNLLQQGLDLPLLPLPSAAEGICIEPIEVGLPGTCMRQFIRLLSVL